MSDITEQVLRPFVEVRDTVWPHTPANSEKEHLSIVTCGHVDNGRMSDVLEQTYAYDAVTDRDVTKKARQKYDHIILEAVRSQ